MQTDEMRMLHAAQHLDLHLKLARCFRHVGRGALEGDDLAHRMIEYTLHLRIASEGSFFEGFETCVHVQRESLQQNRPGVAGPVSKVECNARASFTRRDPGSAQRDREPKLAW